MSTIVDSLVWIVAAGCLAGTAQIAAGVERDAALAIDNRLTREERAAIRHDEMRAVRTRYIVTLALSTVSLTSAALLVPGLIV